MDRSQLAIVIPAYNEENSIAQVVRSVLPMGLVIVVDDKSDDKTACLAEEAGALVLFHARNSGYDQALNTGVAYVLSKNIPYFITMDADGQHSAQSIHHIIDLLEHGNMLVLGVRPKAARCAEWIFGKISVALWGPRDPLCGLKGYNTTLVIANNSSFDSLKSIGTELAINSIRRGYQWKELSIPIQTRTDGSSRFGRSYNANMRIIRAMFRVLFSNF